MRYYGIDILFSAHGLDPIMNKRGITNLKNSHFKLDQICETSDGKLGNGLQPLGGVGKTVEIDESKFGKRKYNGGHRAQGQWVFGGLERESGRIFLVPVEKRCAATLIELFKKWILPGTAVIRDYWKADDLLTVEGYTLFKSLSQARLC